MKIDPVTMLFKELTLDQRREMRAWVEDVILWGKLPAPTPQWVEVWMVACGFSHTQLLFVLSTVLPQRVLLSLLRAGDPAVLLPAGADHPEVGTVALAVTNYAQRLKLRARREGFQDEGGGSEMMTILAAWLAGLRGEIPPQIQRVLDDPGDLERADLEPVPPAT